MNVGCVPKKLMTYGAHYAHDMHDAENFGWEGAFAVSRCMPLSLARARALALSLSHCTVVLCVYSLARARALTVYVCLCVCVCVQKSHNRRESDAQLEAIHRE